MKKFSTISAVIFTSLAMFPLIASAQTGPSVAAGIGTLNGLIQLLTTTVVKSLATLLLSLALLAFFWGIVEYIWGKRQGNGDKVKAGNEFMTWGLIALFVMFSVYGIIKLAQNILGMPNVTTIEIPNITFGGSGGNNSNNITPDSGCVNVAAGTPCQGGAGKCEAGGNCKLNPATTVCTPNASCQGGAGTCNSTGTICNLNGGGKKGLGYACATNSECASGFCDSADSTCSTAQQVGKAGLGWSCQSNSDCASGICDPADSTCSTAQQVNNNAGAADYGCGPGKGYPDEFGSCL